MKTSKHWQTVLDHVADSMATFDGRIVAERVEVALMHIQRVSPRTYTKWMKASEATDLLMLAEQVRLIVVKQRMLDAAAQAESAPEDRSTEGTQDGSVEEDQQGNDDGM